MTQLLHMIVVFSSIEMYVSSSRKRKRFQNRFQKTNLVYFKFLTDRRQRFSNFSPGFWMLRPGWSLARDDVTTSHRCFASCTGFQFPVRQRVSYKIVTLVHQCLSGHVPSYLADDCRLVTDAGVRRLRSAETRTVVVGRTRSSFGDRTFAAAAPWLWNSLPSDIRQPDLSYGQFKRFLPRDAL